MAKRKDRGEGLKITILVEGKTEQAFEPHLVDFLKNRLTGRMPFLDFFPCDGRVDTADKLRRTVKVLLYASVNAITASDRDLPATTELKYLLESRRGWATVIHGFRSTRWHSFVVAGKFLNVLPKRE